jgi:transposase InsO family protein
VLHLLHSHSSEAGRATWDDHLVRSLCEDFAAMRVSGRWSITTPPSVLGSTPRRTELGSRRQSRSDKACGRPSAGSLHRGRHDHGSQYMSEYFQQNPKHLGITSSPRLSANPKGNGCAERFMRTLKDPSLWVHMFDTAEELRLIPVESKNPYNRHRSSSGTAVSALLYARPSRSRRLSRRRQCVPNCSFHEPGTSQ